MLWLQRICERVHRFVEIIFVRLRIVCSVNGADAEPAGIELSVNFLKPSEFFVHRFSRFVNIRFVTAAVDHGVLIILELPASIGRGVTEIRNTVITVSKQRICLQPDVFVSRFSVVHAVRCSVRHRLNEEIRGEFYLAVSLDLGKIRQVLQPARL